MAIIIVSKSGQSFQTRDGDKNPRGEIAGTQDMIRHLSEEGHKVIYFGQHQGDIPYCAATIKPYLEGMSSYQTWREQQNRFEIDTTHLISELTDQGWDGRRPPLWIESCGLSASYSHVGNKRGVTCLLSSMRYTAPILGAMRLLQAPRICLVTDVRSYPRDGEMRDDFPELRPAALLDNTQGGLDKTMIAGFQKWHVRSRDSQSWSWPYLEWLPPCETTMWDVCGASHCHIKTGFRKKWRNDAWSMLLGREGQLLKSVGERGIMYGEGWEHWSGYDWVGPNDEIGGIREYQFPGPCSYPKLMRALSVAKCSPVVAPDERFVTNKPVIIASRGCLPVLLENHAHAWDPDYEIIPRVHALRAERWDETLMVSRYKFEQRLELWNELKLCLGRQRFDTIDQLVADYEGGLYESDRQEWHQRYGGYEAI